MNQNENELDNEKNNNVNENYQNNNDIEELDTYNKNNIDDDVNTDLNASNYDEKLDIEASKSLDFSVILVGDSNVGKTSILNKFIHGSFSNQIKCTINVEFHAKNLKIDKNLYARLTIYDTAGQEKYRALTKNYYRNANGVILVFDLTNENSFTKLNSWIKDINDNAGNVEIILVGNKSDLEDRKIPKLNAERLAKEKSFKYIETSAKEGTNILLLFEELSIGMNKRRNDESSSNVELGSIQTYVFRREELNKELKYKKSAKCC